MLDYMTCSTCFYYSAGKGLCVRYPPQMAQAQPDLDPGLVLPRGRARRRLRPMDRHPATDRSRPAVKNSF